MDLRTSDHGCQPSYGAGVQYHSRGRDGQEPARGALRVRACRPHRGGLPHRSSRPRADGTHHRRGAAVDHPVHERSTTSPHPTLLPARSRHDGTGRRDLRAGPGREPVQPGCSRLDGTECRQRDRRPLGDPDRPRTGRPSPVLHRDRGLLPRPNRGKRPHPDGDGLSRWDQREPHRTWDGHRPRGRRVRHPGPRPEPRRRRRVAATHDRREGLRYRRRYRTPRPVANEVRQHYSQLSERVAAAEEGERPDDRMFM